jgi:hypothetical protein
MADTVKNFYYNNTGGSIGNTNVFTCPGGSIAWVNSIQVANVGGSAAARVRLGVGWYDVSSGASVGLVYDFPVDGGSPPLNALLKPLALEAGDFIYVSKQTTSGSIAVSGTAVETL